MRKLLLFIAVLAALTSCELYNYGILGGADQTGTYYPGDALFEERMNFLSGVWYSHYAGIGRLDGYRIRKWSDFNEADKQKALQHFPALNVSAPETYSAGDTPGPGDYVFMYDDTAYGQGEDGSGGNDDWGFCYMGMVRALNIFNGDTNRGAVIIEYFEEADPRWLYSSQTYSGQSQGLAKGEKPFFGIYYRVLAPNIVQMANAVDLAALYAGDPYYTEKRTLDEALEANGVENEAEFISWGIVIPQDRERE